MGSWPTSMVVADKLNKARGHSAIVYERVDRIGGQTMYGVPNVKKTWCYPTTSWSDGRGRC